MQGSLEKRSKDAANHVGYTFMTNNPESLVTSVSEHRVHLDGRRCGRKGRGPRATLCLEAASGSFHELISSRPLNSAFFL